MAWKGRGRAANKVAEGEGRKPSFEGPRQSEETKEKSDERKGSVGQPTRAKEKATLSTTRDLCGERERQGREEETKKKGERKKSG